MSHAIGDDEATLGPGIRMRMTVAAMKVA